MSDTPELKPLTLSHPGAHLGALRGHQVVRDFAPGGDEAAEFQALTRGAALLDRSQRSLLKLTGPERESFLHGQTTNDVKGLGMDRGHEAALLTHKGKMVGFVRVFKRADALWVESDVGYGEAVSTQLQKMCISEEVEFEDLSPALACLGVYGPEAAWALAKVVVGVLPVGEHALAAGTVAGVPVTLAGATLGPLPGFDLFVPRGQLQAVWEALQGVASPAGEAAWELARLVGGVPRPGVELTEDTNPLEANLERAISYNKGCYIGQEVIAKATFRGHVTRKLAAFTLTYDGAAPPMNTELLDGERVVGRLTTAALLPDGSKLGLGYVKRDLAGKPGTVLRFAGGQATVR